MRSGRTLLPYAKVSRKDARVVYEFTRAFQERVYNPTEFAEIALRMQRVFRSEHALALYENTRRFLPEGETPWIPLDTFRTLMGVAGKPYYDEYKYLSARLIKPAMQQVNEVSDIVLQLQTKRVNRTVAGIRFRVSLNRQMSLFTESLIPATASPRGGGRTSPFVTSCQLSYHRQACRTDLGHLSTGRHHRRSGRRCCLDGGQGS